MILSVRTLAEVINNKARIVFYDNWYTQKNVYYYDSEGKKWYIKTVYNGQYTFTRDPLYAKHFTEKTAVKHMNTLSDMLRHNEL